MPAEVFRTDRLEREERGQGIRSLPLASPRSGATQLLTGLTEIPLGGVIPLHTHSSEEFILVLSGKALVRVEGERHEVGPLDATFVPQDTPHQFINIGTETLKILWVYGDQRTTRTLVETGVTLGHLDPYPDDPPPR